MFLSRRQAVAALSASAALPLVSGCSRAVGAPVVAAPVARATTDAEASAILNSIAENLLRLSPESATSLGIDKGERAALRSQLSDRSAAGQQRLADTIRADLARANAIDTSGLGHSMRTSVEVVRSAYATALEGFALPYGDVAVGGWRNTPYVVIQNVGAYLDVPRFLDSDHPIENAADAEAYLARLQSYAKQLDGELGRDPGGARRRPGPAGVPDRQGASPSSTLSREERARGRSARRVDRAAHPRKNIAGNWAERARAIARQGGRAGARPADRRAQRRNAAWRPTTPGMCGAARAARSTTAGRSRPRPPRRCRPTRSTRWARAS